jgi:ketosteroid isomerase-like protein
MSQENVEMFKRALDAGNRRDIDGLTRDLHAEAEWHTVLASALTAEPTVYRGLEGIREGLARDLLASFDEIHFQMSEIRDLGNRVLAVGHMRARGLESGVDTESPWAFLVQFKNGKAIWVRAFLDPREALEAAGLKE